MVHCHCMTPNGGPVTRRQRQGTSNFASSLQVCVGLDYGCGRGRKMFVTICFKKGNKGTNLIVKPFGLLSACSLPSRSNQHQLGVNAPMIQTYGKKSSSIFSSV